MVLNEPDSSLKTTEITPSTPPLSPISDAATPIVATARKTTLTDSLVSISLTDRSRESNESAYSSDATSKDGIEEQSQRVSLCSTVEDTTYGTEQVVESLSIEKCRPEEVAPKKETARSRSNSMALNALSRGRSDSIASDASLQVDWETLDKTEETQDQEDDEVIYLILDEDDS